MKRLVLVVALVGGCAVADHGNPGGNGGGNGRDGGGGNVVTDAGAGDDLAQPPTGNDLSMAKDLSTPSDLARPDLSSADLTSPPQSSCVPRINEIMTGTTGSGTNEFVELYNPCTGSIALDAWKLVYRAGTNVNPASSADSSTLFSFASGSSIGAGRFLVYAGAAFTGAKDGALTASLKDGDGSVGLRDGSGALVDSVGYGTVDPSNAFIRGSAATAPPVTSSGGSIGRRPDGSDTEDNSVDFKISSAISPGAANY